MTELTLVNIAPMLAVLAGVFGLLIGSFLNVVVYRVPVGMSLVTPASACPNCHHEIKGYDNVPVLSWLALRGKCRNCKMPISARYPIVELVTGIAFVAVALYVVYALTSAQPGPTPSGLPVILAFLYLAAITIALGIIDIETHKLPNRIVLPAYIVASVLFTITSVMSGDYSGLLRAGIGGAAMFIAYFLMAIAYPKGMGFGDVKLAGVLGLYLGWVGFGALIVGAFAAFLVGGVYAVGLIIARRANRKSGIPFGPWMFAGAWIGIFAGNQIWDGYLSLIGAGS